jgi:hypothetical protein
VPQWLAQFPRAAPVTRTAYAGVFAFVPITHDAVWNIGQATT